MGQQVFDIETVGFNGDTLGHFFDFYVNNTFYLLAPSYYKSFYSIYLNRCLALYDGWVGGFHNKEGGLVPQRMLQSMANGLNNMLFAHGIDFTDKNTTSYNYAVKWSKQSKFYKALKKAHKFAIAGGTSLLKLNRQGKDLFATAHRIDTFFADIDANGKVVGVKVFFDAVHNMSNDKDHWGICEERFFGEDGKAYVMSSVYQSSGNLQTEVSARQSVNNPKRVNWENLSQEIRTYIKQNYPSILIGKPQLLPFAHSLGCYLIKFTDDIPQVPNSQLGQPIGDILSTESFQYDQLKYFEKNEVDLARARALVPEEFWNPDDPDHDRTLNERFYQKVSSVQGDSDKITPIQFALRGMDIKTQAENIYKDVAYKLQISASSVASFLSEGAGARTATEIVSERTKTDTWIKGQINLNAPEVNDLLKTVMIYYNYDPVEIIFKPENQSPFLETLKTNSDVFSAGNMTPEMFVRQVYGHLTQEEQAKEIANLEKAKQMREQVNMAMASGWTKKE